MGKGYVCEKCNHASGYHKDCGEYFGKCRIIDCDCENFEWSEEDWEKYERRRTQENAKEKVK